ncbi:MAG: hypothetical protein JWN70_6591 [Planctomycetaceae bacterium]|nr:hypothetical protein [Planctomycetaceae bacterium]
MDPKTGTLAILLPFLLFVFLICLPYVFWPEAMWRRFSAWEYKHPEANEPSSQGYAMQRVSYSIIALTCVIMSVILILIPDPPKKLMPSPTAKSDLHLLRTRKSVDDYRESMQKLVPSPRK